MADPTVDPKGGVTPPAGAPEAKKEVPSDDAAAKRLADLEKQNQELQEEAKQRRLEAKKLKEEREADRPILEGLKKLFTPPGDNKATTPEEQIASVTKAQADKTKRMLLRSAVVAEVAKDAHDAEDVWALAQAQLKDVTVDLDNETVDKAAVKAKVDELRKNKPFLFQQPKSGTENMPGAKQPVSMPGGPNASVAGSEYQQWKTLMDSGNTRAAGEFYQKNRSSIVSQMPK